MVFQSGAFVRFAERPRNIAFPLELNRGSPPKTWTLSLKTSRTSGSAEVLDNLPSDTFDWNEAAVAIARALAQNP